MALKIKLNTEIMRKIKLLVLLLFFGITSALAQTRVVSGRVTDKDGNAVPFATVALKEGKTALSADANGIYTIRVKDGDVLKISGTGFTAVEVPVGNLTSI